MCAKAIQSLWWEDWVPVKTAGGLVANWWVMGRGGATQAAFRIGKVVWELYRGYHDQKGPS